MVSQPLDAVFFVPFIWYAKNFSFHRDFSMERRFKGSHETRFWQNFPHHFNCFDIRGIVQRRHG